MYQPKWQYRLALALQYLRQLRLRLLHTLPTWIHRRNGSSYSRVVQGIDIDVEEARRFNSYSNLSEGVWTLEPALSSPCGSAGPIDTLDSDDIRLGIFVGFVNELYQ